MAHTETADRGTAVIPPETFGERVRRSRRHAGLTAPQLAVQLGLSPGAVAQWETEGKRPRDIVGTSQEVARICGVDYIWLLTGDGKTRGCLALPPPVVKRNGRAAPRPKKTSAGDLAA